MGDIAVLISFRDSNGHAAINVESPVVVVIVVSGHQHHQAPHAGCER